MCYNCGCHNPHDDMGSPDNITEQTLIDLSTHLNKSLTDTKLYLIGLLETKNSELEKNNHLKEMFEKSSKAWGQSVDEAKKNTLDLLKSQVKKN